VFDRGRDLRAPVFRLKRSTSHAFEFRCKKCSKTFDDKETFAEHDKHPKVKCPHCGSTAVEPVVTPVLVKTSKKS
jgi:putative FmdB family regulatory protein